MGKAELLVMVPESVRATGRLASQLQVFCFVSSSMQPPAS